MAFIHWDMDHAMFRSSLRQVIEQSFSILRHGNLSFLLVTYLTNDREDSWLIYMTVSQSKISMPMHL